MPKIQVKVSKLKRNHWETLSRAAKEEFIANPIIMQDPDWKALSDEWQEELAALKRLKEILIPPTTPDIEQDEMKSQYFTQVRLIGDTLSNDSSTRSQLCPKCGGGETKERAFSVSKDAQGFLYWHCFRASCGYKGSTGGGSKGKRTLSREPNPLTSPLINLDEEQIDFFNDEFGINAQGAGIRFCAESGGFAIPVKGFANNHIGWVQRWFDGRSPKARNYPELVSKPFISFHYPGAIKEGLPIVIVEDQLSAMKFYTMNVRAVALLGTTLNWEMAYEIRQLGPYITLALDRGTLPLSLQYKSKYELMFDKIDIWQLDKDLKYLRKDRIAKALAGDDKYKDFITYR